MEEKPQEVIYVDRDRAAAVQLGSKDIKNDLRFKRRRDRMENAQVHDDDEISFATFIAQGDHELKYVFFFILQYLYYIDPSPPLLCVVQ